MTHGDATQDSMNLDSVRAGLRMSNPPDPAQLEAEKQALAAVEHAPTAQRYGFYAKLSGPGFLQSAMTLGSGSAAASLFAGAAFGYSLLWVAPVGMLIGVVVLGAIAHQTLSTGMQPFEAMRKFAGAPLAWAWAIGALVASIIWHLPQYSLASACLSNLGELAGIEGLEPGWMGVIVLVWAVGISWMYGRTPGLVRAYERTLKYIVWGVVVCFAIVVWNTGVRDWGELAAGFFSFEIPGERNGIQGIEVVVAGLAAAVGINMVFLYPYSLLARGWGREHRQLARFDLMTGMLVPYALATSLMVIATANTVNLDPAFEATRLSPIQAATSMFPDSDFGRVVFLVGVLGMVLSTITLHMTTCGFVCSQLFGWQVGSMKYRLATWLPTPAVLAPIAFPNALVWLAVPTSIICGLFLPLAYVGFALLHRNRSYLGDDTPSGLKGKLWVGAIFLATALLVVALALYLINKFS